MEKKGIKCSYAVLVCILFAALAFVVDYSIIERKTSKCNCTDCSLSDNTVVDANLRDVAHFNDYGQIIVTKDGNVLFSPNKNLIENEILIKGEYEVDEDIIGFDYDKFDGYKLNTSNIRSAYSFGVGNGGITIHVVLLTRDNKVEIMKLEEIDNSNIEVSFKKLDQLSNIVTAVEDDSFGAHGYAFYDSKGNLVKPSFSF